MSHKNLDVHTYVHVHNSNVYDDQKVGEKKTQMSINGWINEMGHTHLIEYYLDIEKNELLVHVIK